MNWRKRCAEFDETVLFLEGPELDAAIVGLASRCGQPPMLVYSTRAIVEILRRRDGMTLEEATEFFDFNIGGAWLGPSTPAYLDDTSTFY